MSQSAHLPLVVAILVAVLTIVSLAFAGSVWQRRRSAATDRRRSPRQIGSFVCLVASALLLAISVSFHLFTRRIGNLQTHDLLVVRAQPDMGLPRYDHDVDREVGPGETLLHFERPAGTAELRAMELELRVREDQRESIRARVRDIDPELGRERVRLDADSRLLTQRRRAARFALGFTETQTRLEILGHQTRLHEVSTELERLRGRLATNRSELTYAAAVADSRADLERQKAAAPLDVQEGSCDVETLTAQREQLEREQRQQGLLQRELAAGVATLQARLEDHRVEVEQELSCIDAKLRRLAERRAAHDASVCADRARVERLRTAELRVEDGRTRALAMRLEQEREERRVTAPARGRILYQHPAPGSARAHEPILAFGSTHSLRVRLRLGRAEAERLAWSGPVPLRVTAAVDEPRFTGTFLNMREVRSEPGLALVELSCRRGEDVVRELIEGSRLAAELDWAPPLYLDPIVGLAMVLLACHLWLRFRPRWLRRSDPSRRPARAVAHRPLTS